MFTLLFSLRDCFRSRAVLQAEILALRHQLLIFERSSRGHNLRLRWTDRALWVWLSRLWSDWRHGRPAVSLEVRNLIRQMSLVNPRWGAPRNRGQIHGPTPATSLPDMANISQ